MATPVLPTRLSNQTGTSFTFDAFDQNATVVATNGSAITATLPASTSVNYPIGTVITVVQGGAGAVTITAPSDGTITPATSNTVAAGSMLFLVKTTATNWFASYAAAA